ncbi:hypothetical protein [Nonomuraea rubra]|uniref:Uncharacterized protein n=1 Tax=Nonomuraea rubra TaxID=46180 RepID=A0A7X0NLZ7_9ACTN|nr:hypothetical protein [Nonomuraea rubra]MBB6545861.1 hypothetical protein [Nonomuraea rubra]
MSAPPSHFEYHGDHPARPHDRALRVRWQKSEDRCAKVRVREHTCMCLRPAYELCTAGGLWFVRRFTGKDLEIVVESAWMSARAARTLWMRIMTGQAR